METPVVFSCDGFGIEALLAPAGERAVVVTHPHPLYGGDMHNPVADVIRRAYAAKGFTTLRFNFRGTGHSGGQFDDGRGERADVAAAVAYLQARGLADVHLSGYSFGAWVNALACCDGLRVARLTMVSPPAAFLSFAEVGALPALARVVTGSADEIAPPSLIGTLLPAWNPHAELAVIEGADHFYVGYAAALAKALVKGIGD
jgi:alpha/beta superfamily hydrolase